MFGGKGERTEDDETMSPRARRAIEQIGEPDMGLTLAMHIVVNGVVRARVRGRKNCVLKLMGDERKHQTDHGNT